MVKDFPIWGVFTPETDYVDQLPLNTEERKILKKTTAQSLNSLQKELGWNYQKLKIKGKVKTFDANYGLRVRDENGNKIGTIYKGEGVRILERKKWVIIENGQKKNFVKVDVYNERGGIDKARSGWVAEDFIEIDSKSIDNQIQHLEEKVKEETVVKPKEAAEKNKRTKSIVKPKEASGEDQQKWGIVKPKEANGDVKGWGIVKPKETLGDEDEKKWSLVKPKDAAEKKPESAGRVPPEKKGKNISTEEQELLAAGTHSILNGKVVPNSEIDKIRNEATRKKAEADEATRKKAEADEATRKKAEADEATRKKAEADEATRKKAEADEATRKKAEADEATRKKAEADEATRKKAEADEATRKKAEADEATRKKAEADEATRKKAEADEATRKKAEADEATRKKAEADEATRKKAEADEATRKKAEADEATRKKAEADEATRKKEAYNSMGTKLEERTIDMLKVMSPNAKIAYERMVWRAQKQQCNFIVADKNKGSLYLFNQFWQSIVRLNSLYGRQKWDEIPKSAWSKDVDELSDDEKSNTSGYICFELNVLQWLPSLQCVECYGRLGWWWWGRWWMRYSTTSGLSLKFMGKKTRQIGVKNTKRQ
jgi:hypothetical protein